MKRRAFIAIASAFGLTPVFRWIQGKSDIHAHPETCYVVSSYHGYNYLEEETHMNARVKLDGRNHESFHSVAGTFQECWAHVRDAIIQHARQNEVTPIVVWDKHVEGAKNGSDSMLEEWKINRPIRHLSDFTPLKTNLT